MSDLGSPRDDLQSLDSWTTVDNALETSTPGSSVSRDNTIDFTCNSCESSYIAPISHDGSPKQVRIFFLNKILLKFKLNESPLRFVFPCYF